MGIARYKTSNDGCFRLYVQQTGISGNNAVLSAWIAVKNSAYVPVDALNNPKITIGGTTRTGSSTSVSGATDWKTVYSVSGITYAYATGATGGSVSVSASGSLHFMQTEESDAYWASESVSANYELDTRTISGTITATNAALNANPTFTIGSYNSAYTYGISYSIGNASGTVATGISASTYNGWTVPQSIGAQIPAGYTGTITYTLTTYSGSTAVGTATTTASITVPSYSYTVAAPTASKGSYSTIGAYVAGKTKVDFAVPAPPAASYGATYTYTATITQGSSTLASQAFTAAGTISATPTGTGTVTCTVTMTDSRGATKSNSASVTYVANTLPTVTLSAYRVGSSGSTTQDITGAYYYATASGTYNALTNNTCTLTLTTTSTGTASGSSGKVSKTASGSLATTNTLTVTAKVQDALGNVATATAIIPQGFAVVQFGTGSDHKGVSIGKVGQVASAGVLEVGYDADFDGYVKKKSSYIYRAALSDVLGGGYIKFAHILIKSTYRNDAIEWSIIQRYSAIPTTITLRFANANSTDPNVTYLYHIGEKAYAAKTNAGEWDVYVTNSGSYNSFTVCDEKYNYQRGGIEITYTNEYVATLPEGYIASVENPYYSGGGGGTGTITGVSVNGTSVATSGVANITNIPASILSGTVKSDGYDVPQIGKNYIGGFGVLDAPLCDYFGACRTFFARPNGITIEYSRDSGATWIDFSATDAQKIALFSTGFNFVLGNYSGDQTADAKANAMLRATLSTSAAYVYTELDKFMINVSTNGAVGLYLTIDKAKQSTPTSWENVCSGVSLEGWSGWNVINVPKFRTYGNNASTQYGKIRFTFGCSGGGGDTREGANIIQILGYGGFGWTTPSNMAKHGHLYNFDSSQNCTFPANVTSPLFIGKIRGLLEGVGRLTSADIPHQYENNAVHLRVDNATSSMTTGKPATDGYIITFQWDNSGYWDSQMFLPIRSGASPQYRIQNGSATWGAWKNFWTEDNLTPSAQTITAISLTASAISATNSSAICTLTNRSYTLNNTEVYINVQCVLSSGVSLAGNDWWRLVRDFPMPKGATASTTDMGVSLNAVLYQSSGDYAGQVDAHIAYHAAETNRPAGWYLRVHTNVQLTAGMKVIASGSYLI